MTTLTLDGLNEEEFRRSIEMRLRHDLAGAALDRLRGLIAPYAAPGGPLPERFLTVAARDLNLYGWDGLADALRRHDRPGRPVTAISIAFAWPGEDAPRPDDEGRLNPLVETAYYTDDSFPFSASSREDLLDGYSYHGCTWADDSEASENTISVGGIDDLHGALARLEARLLASEEPDAEDIKAGSLGACLLSVLLHQAVADRVARDGLPRPLCVMAGSNGVYPYFDAPVVGLSEEARRAAEAAEEDEVVDTGVPGPRYSSLLVAGIPRARKRAVLVLDESEEDAAVRIAALRGITHRDDAPALPDLPAVAQAGDVPAARTPDTTITPIPGGPLMTKKPSGQAWDFRDMLGPPRDDEAALAEPLPEPEPPQEPATPRADLLPVEPPSVDPDPPRAEKPPVPDLPFDFGIMAPPLDLGGPDEPEVPPGEPDPDEPDEPIADLPPLAPPPLVDPLRAPRPRFPSQAPVAGVPAAVGPGFALLDPALRDRLDSLLAPHVPERRPVEPVPFARPEPTPVVEARGPELGPVWPFGISWLEEEAALAVAPEPEQPAPRVTLWSRFLDWLGRR
ncbi:hypothetical protein B0I00_2605 [Novosphingobium kunmingense]|uniref:Uncharacterized protein n=1 Tax=Novosphingobium kunmingense TaxID=1211806 RepID=A0A2N0H4X4_9SPHN|nr:hypothetical protein [Novosphingobium kunmingense]PKB13977.1 hypothetical protein B0I00_2605 [Novosphingobium kunmingense]